MSRTFVFLCCLASIVAGCVDDATEFTGPTLDPAANYVVQWRPADATDPHSVEAATAAVSAVTDARDFERLAADGVIVLQRVTPLIEQVPASSPGGNTAALTDPLLCGGVPIAISRTGTGASASATMSMSGSSPGYDLTYNTGCTSALHAHGHQLDGVGAAGRHDALLAQQLHFVELLDPAGRR